MENALTMKARIRAGLTPRWQIEPDVDLTFHWTRPPILNLGPFEVDLRERRDPRLQEKCDEVETQVEARIRSGDLLRPRMEEAWAAIQAPLPVAEDPPAWLHVEPVDIIASDPTWWP